jgi:hypothetical protein
MTDRPFDPSADAAANYFFAKRMVRLREVITGEVVPSEGEHFSLVDAASLARVIERQDGVAG